MEGRRPKALCPSCREALKQATTAPSHGSHRSHSSHLSHLAHRPLCFQCYRADVDRERALFAAGALDTASDARFQVQLPFEPVNRARLDALKAVRAEMRTTASQGVGQYADKRRHAQIAARHALQSIVAGLQMRRLTPAALTAATHAAELQLPEAWLPFVVSR